MTARGARLRALGPLVACALWPLAGSAAADLRVGEILASAELRTLDGGREGLLSCQARANVFAFFRPRQEHSIELLRDLARCREQLAGKPVHWVAVVSSGWPAEEVRAALEASGARLPVLVDDGDALYGRLGVRQHPAVGVADGAFRLVAWEPFRKINQRDRLIGKIQQALGEIDHAEVARVDGPPAALFPNALPGALENRHVGMGEAYLRARSFERAAAEARRVLAEHPGNARAQRLLGDALASLGRCGEAAASFAAAAVPSPDPGALPARRLACVPRSERSGP